jgi:multidrug resistance efflux pump
LFVATSIVLPAVSTFPTRNTQGLATVNPIFTWVRLAQRIPVRIHIDEVPEGVVLAAGMTATVQIDPRPRP